MALCNNNDQIAYKMQTSPNKDIGLFASRPIARGELIISEKPLLTLNGYVSVQDLFNDLKEKVEKLSKFDQDLFKSLHNSWPMISSTDMGIFKTNALPLGHNSPIGAIFPTISRINHSCLPNVNHYWNESKKVETIYALKDISKDEEILTSYIEIYDDKKSRQALLQEGFKFICACEICSIQDIKLQKQSDLRRNNLKELDAEIPQLGVYNPAKALEKIYLMEKLVKEEGIDYDANRMGRLAYDAFSISYQTTKKQLHYWARLTIDNFMVSQGEFDARFKKEVHSYYMKKSKK